MRNILFHLFTVLAFGLPAFGFAQDLNKGCGVSGQVQSETAVKLEFVTLNLVKLSDSSLFQTVISDAAGGFNFDNVPPGEYQVTASFVGYEKKKLPSFSLEKNCNTSLQLGMFVLNNISKTGEEVVIVSKRPAISRKLDKTIVNIENSSLASGSTAFEVLQIAPGVTVANDDKIELFAKGSPLILVDGKPTYLSNENLTNWLKSMPSNIISEIEIISQPSAKYDAAGVSGIINIKTKRIKTTGFTGNVSGGAGYGRKEKYRGALNLAYKGNKYAVTTDYAYAFNNTIRYLDIGRYLNSNSGTTYFDRSGDITDQIKSNSFKSTFTYYINSKNSIGLQVLGYDNRQAPVGYNYTGIFSETGKKDSSLVSTADEKSSYKSFGGNFNFSSKLDSLGRELSFDADASKFTNRTMRHFTNTQYDGGGNISNQPSSIRNLFPTDIEVTSLKLDLTYPIRNLMNIEAGVKSSFVSTDNDATFDSLINNEWKPSLLQNNHFKYKENINAAYISASKEFKQFSAQAGLRVEQTITDANLITLNEQTKRNYVNFFPSIFLSKDFKNNKRISISYSRRVERPNYQNLNPFRFYDDKYTFHEGNPNLKPSFTNSFEFNAIIKNTYSFLLQYAKSNDVFAEDIRQQTENGIVYTSSYFRNYQAAKTLTASFSYSKDVNDWWSTDNSVTLTRTHYDDDDGILSRKLTNYNFSLNMYQYFQITKSVSGEFSGFYRTPSLYGFIKTTARYKLNVGLKKNLWKKKANIKLRLNDIFNTNRFEGNAKYGDVDVRINNRFESRSLFLTFSYNFGNSKFKVKTKDGGAGDVKERVKKESE